MCHRLEFLHCFTNLFEVRAGAVIVLQMMQLETRRWLFSVHQAVVLYYGANLVPWPSQCQCLVALPSAEAELIAASDDLRPAHTTFSDNVAVVQLSQQPSASKARTRRLSMREQTS